MIVITGSSGKLARASTELLLNQVPADHVSVSVREPERAARLHQLGVRVGRCDFADPASLLHSLEGASQVLIASPGATGDTAARLNRGAFRSPPPSHSI